MGETGWFYGVNIRWFFPLWLLSALINSGQIALLVVEANKHADNSSWLEAIYGPPRTKIATSYSTEVSDEVSWFDRYR